MPPVDPELEPPVDVAAALIERNGRYLVARRLDDAALGGFREFPGGKRLPGESLEACVRREVHEELGVEIAVGDLYRRSVHAYSHATIALHLFRATLIAGTPHAVGCAEVRWVTAPELATYRFPPANDAVIRQLARPPS